jgi:hypothetical protein
MQLIHIIPLALLASALATSYRLAEMAKKQAAPSARNCRHVYDAKNLQSEPRRMVLATCDRTFPGHK